jgi:toxin ParE1/3/4
MLLERPYLGHPGRAAGTREMAISHTRYTVIYLIRPRARRIEIKRLLHASKLQRS